MSCPHILVITRHSRGSTMRRCSIRGKRPWWAKISVSWRARWKTATHLSALLVILWLLLRNKTKFTPRRHPLRKILWLWWKIHTHLYHWWIAVNSGSWYHRWIHALLLFRDHVYQKIWSPLITRLSFLMQWRCFKISHMSSWALIYGCLSETSRFFHYPTIIVRNKITTLACPSQRVQMQITLLTLSLK